MFRLTLLLFLAGAPVPIPAPAPAHGPSPVPSAWPDCIVPQVDDTGDDLVSGLRFSDEQCANWCKKVSGCVRWVYVEKGPKCYIKAYDGKPRTIDDPLTPEDEKEFAEEVTEAPEGSGDNSTDTSDQSGSAPAPSPAPAPAPAPASAPAPAPASGTDRKKRQTSEPDQDQPEETKEDRIQKRIEELKVTFTGASACMPPEEGKIL